MVDMSDVEPRSGRARAIRQSFDSTHFVYECYDYTGHALYVGCSSNPMRRLSDHAKKPWWHMVHEIRMTSYPNRVAGQTIELRLIHELEPQFNTQGISHDSLRDRANA